VKEARVSLPENRIQGDLEKALCQIFSDTLNVPEVSIHDNFFDLGGHSLTAFRLASRIEKALGIPAGIQDVFDAPTVAELAVMLAERNR
jgi:acyl carrier protein